MPNWSHGLAGIAAALARAGVALDRPDLVEAARRGAEHLVTLADPASLADGGLAVPRRIPHKPDHDEYTWNWCHGPAGNLALFEALDAAGVPAVAGEPPTAWVARCLHSLRTSGIPERRWPGFWDNDGRCCGTAGVGSAVLPHDPAFAVALADDLVDRAYVEGDRAYWRFTEHRNDGAAAPAGRRLDAGRGGHRRVPVRGGPALDLPHDGQRLRGAGPGRRRHRRRASRRGPLTSSSSSWPPGYPASAAARWPLWGFSSVAARVSRAVASGPSSATARQGRPVTSSASPAR